MTAQPTSPSAPRVPAAMAGVASANSLRPVRLALVWQRWLPDVAPIAEAAAAVEGPGTQS